MNCPQCTKYCYAECDNGCNTLYCEGCQQDFYEVDGNVVLGHNEEQCGLGDATENSNDDNSNDSNDSNDDNCAGNDDNCAGNDNNCAGNDNNCNNSDSEDN